MSALPDGGPAFPNHPPLDPEGGSASGYPFPAEGMTLRDYFAAKAMQSYLYQPEWEAMPVEHVAAWAYEQADAMLKAREA